MPSDGVDEELGGRSVAPPPRGSSSRRTPAFWKNNVQVVIRIRPLSSSEICLQGHKRCVQQDSSQILTFDLVADKHVTQENMFKVAGVPMVENCISGYNTCMFAYGQTGSGRNNISRNLGIWMQFQ